MTLYLLDANVLIRAHEDYYPIDRIPPFWLWLQQQCESDRIKMPRPIYDEVAPSTDLLGQWLRRQDVKQAIVLNEQINPMHVRDVINGGYAADLDEVELQRLGQDPFLVASARSGPQRVVVTRERSRPSALRANRRIPDVCDTLGIRAIDDFALYRELSFRIP